MVLNIFSYWAEHKGRIPISNVCRRPRLGNGPQGPPQPHSHRTRPLSPGRPSYRQDLLAVQALAVEEQGVHRVPCASSLYRCGRDIQEVLGAEEGTAKRLGSGLPQTPKHRSCPQQRANGGFKTAICITDPKPHMV